MHGDGSSVGRKNAILRVHQAVQYLHAYAANFDKVPEADLAIAVDAVEDCVSASYQQSVTEPLYVTKLLANCVAKAARMV